MSTAAIPLIDTDLALPGGHVTVLMGYQHGKYPSGNSMLVQGSLGALLIDPSIDVHQRGGAPAAIDRMLISHAHEDHIAGISVFPDAELHAHHHDVAALHHLDKLLEVYGMPEPGRTTFAGQLLSDFHYTPRPDATGIDEGTSFDLGGVSVTVVHLPGHTRGHCGFMVEPDGVFFVADVDLSSFGPYYGDHWSDLEDFERAIERCRTIEARHYVTFHHKGVVDGQAEFVKQLDTFAAVIGARERRLLDYLSEPRTMADIVAYRLVYRPGPNALVWTDHVEEVSAGMHLQRLERTGEVLRLESGQWRRA